MFFGLIDISEEGRRRRAEQSTLRFLRRRIRRDEDGVPYVVGAHVVKAGETRPLPVKPLRAVEGDQRRRLSEADKKMVTRLIEMKRQEQRLDAAAGTVIESAEGTMTFTGYQGPGGAELRAAVGRRRRRLLEGAETDPPHAGESARSGRKYSSQNLLYG